MARPQPPESPAVQQQYLAQLALTAALVQALRQLWGATLPLESPRGRERFREGVFVLVQNLAGSASSIATDYYRAIRAEAGVTAPLPPRASDPIAPPPRSLVDAGLDWAMRQAEEQTRLLREQADRDVAAMEADLREWESRALFRAEAMAQKAVVDTARDQVIASVEGDELALGFRRVPRPDACYFCIVMAIRSTTRKGLAKDFKRYAPDTMGGEKHYGVYKTRGSAGATGNFLFDGDGEAKFHNNCHCVIEPVFAPAESLPGWLADMERLYDQTEGGLQEFRRALNDHRRGITPPPPPIPAVVTPRPDERIAALLDLLTQQAA